MAYDIGPRIGIQGEAEYRKQIQNLTNTQRTLKTEMQAVTSAYDANDRSVEKLTSVGKVLAKQVDVQKQKLGLLKDELNKAKEKYGETSRITQGWERAVNSATAELNRMDRQLAENTQELEAATDGSRELAEQLEALEENAQHAGEELENVGSKLEGAGKKMLVLSAAIAAGAVSAGKAAIAYESAFTGVTKTVDGTEEELATISEGIREMSKEIPASAVAIAGVAEQAGQLGIATEDVLSFSKVMIDLGESTNLSANVAADSLSRFANITGLDPSDYERLGSAIVDLGNNAATTESEIVAMSTRIAATGELVGLSEPQILALATTLSSLGIEAEAGGSAISKLLKEFEVMIATGSEGLEDFAKVAGLTADQFATIWNNDPTKALAAFLDGLNKVGEEGGSTVAVLEDLGITEIRMSNATAALGTASELLTENLGRANQAWDENTALATEAEKRYQTTESQIQIAKNTLQDMAITMGSEFLPMVINVTEKVRDLGERFSDLDDREKENVIQILAATAAMGPMFMLVGKGAKAVATLSRAVAVQRAQMIAQAAANTTVATTALPAISSMKALGAVMMANPMGIAITAATAFASLLAGEYVSNFLLGKNATDGLSSSVKDLRKEYEEAMASIGESSNQKLMDVSTADSLIDKFQQLNSVVEKTPGEMTQLAVYAEKINELLGTQALVVNETGDAYVSTVGNIDNYILKLQEQIEVEAAVAAATAAAQATISTKAAIAEREKLIASYQLEIDQLGELRDVTGGTQSEINSLKEEQKSLQAEVEALNGDLEKQTGEYEQLQAGVEDAVRSFDSASASTENFSDATKEALGSVDLASTALDEYTKTGDLSHEMTQRLIEAGYLSADAMNTETGAAYLDEEAMLSVAMAKLEEREATLEASKVSIADKLNLEGAAASLLAGDMIAAAAAISLQARAATLSKGAIDSEIAAIAESKQSIVSRLNSIKSSTAATSAGTKATKGSTKAVDKNAEAFKTARKEIEYQRDMGTISEKAFYDELEKLQIQYLKESSEEWKSINVEIYKWQEKERDEAVKAAEESYKGLTESLSKEYDNGLIDLKTYIANSKTERDRHLANNSKAWLTATETMQDEIMSVYDEITQEQKRMANSLSGYGDIFDEDGNLANLKDQIKEIERYGDALEELKEKGISEGLLSEIADMNIDDGLARMDDMLKLSPSKLKEYNEDWETIQASAKRVAETFYKDQAEELQKHYIDVVKTELGMMETEAYGSGMTVAENFTKGATGENLGVKMELTTDVTQEFDDSNLKFTAYMEEWEEKQTQIQEVAVAFTQVLEDELRTLEDASYEIGLNSMDEMKKGIEDGKSAVVNAIIATVQAAIRAARSELGINSPATEFIEMGDYSVDGYILPWKTRAAEVQQSVADTLAAGTPSGRSSATNGAATSTIINEGDFVLNVAAVNNSNDREVQDVLRVAEHLRQQNQMGRGGR